MNSSAIRKLLFVLVVFATTFSTIVAPASASAATQENHTLSVASLARTCRNGSLYWNDAVGYGFRLWREYLEFDWCFDGRSVDVSRVNHWYKISFPNTNVKWKTESISNGSNGSKIIQAQGEVELCMGWCWKKYTTMKLKLTKDGNVTLGS